MALILDKSYTGITSTDASGNTTETGYTHLNYTDPFGGVHENPYLVIDDVIIDKARKFVRIGVSIYINEQSRQDGRKAVEASKIELMGNDQLYDTYFSISSIEQTNVFEAAYSFVSDLYYKGWKSDEVS